MNTRTATVRRATAETDVTVELSLDGTGKADVSTGIGFYDHLLTALAVGEAFDQHPPFGVLAQDGGQLLHAAICGDIL